MGKLARFGVSLDEELLAPFDQLCREKGYTTRSEAIRDLLRGALAQASFGSGRSLRGVLTLVFDHHKHDLSRRLMNLQHDSHDLILTTMHVHLDHSNCMEVLILKGDNDRVRGLSQKLISCRGVKYGIFNPVPEGEELA